MWYYQSNVAKHVEIAVRIFLSWKKYCCFRIQHWGPAKCIFVGTVQMCATGLCLVRLNIYGEMNKLHTVLIPLVKALNSWYNTDSRMPPSSRGAEWSLRAFASMRALRFFCEHEQRWKICFASSEQFEKYNSRAASTSYIGTRSSC